MKKILLLLAGALVAACPMCGFSAAAHESDPAYLAIDKAVDLKLIPPQVNINLPRFLLKDTINDLAGTTNGPLAGKGPEFAELVKDVKLIRLVIIEANKTNRPALDSAIKTLRAELEAKWTPIVTVPEENIGVYAMSDASGDKVGGMAVLVYDDGDAVIGNVVGNVPIGKAIRLASQMNKLPKGLLQQLAGMSGSTNASTGSAAPKSAGQGSETAAKSETK